MPPKIPPSRPDEDPAPEVHGSKAGVGDGLANKGYPDPSLEPYILSLTSPAKTLTTRQSSVSDAGILLTSAETTGVVASGGTGARADGQQSQGPNVFNGTNHVTVIQHMKNTVSATTHDEYNIGHGARAATPTSLSGHSSSSVHCRDVVSKSQATVMAPIGPVAPETVPGISDLVVELPETVTSESTDQYMDISGDEGPLVAIPSTADAFASRVKTIGDDIVASYNAILPLLRRRTSPQFFQSICIQSGMFTEKNRWLFDKIDAISVHDPESQEVYESPYVLVYSELVSLQKHMKLLRSGTGKEALAQKERTSPSNLGSRGEFKSWCKHLTPKYQRYAKAADVLTRERDHNLITGQTHLNGVLGDLLTDAQTCSCLRQCLCQAFPDQCHNDHTAYLGLQPDDWHTDVAQTSGKKNEVEEKLNTKSVWHLAFKSTKSAKTTATRNDHLIWLRVESCVVEVSSFRELSFQGHNQEAIDDSGMLDPPSTEGTGPHNLKRKASSQLPEPPGKCQKTRPNQTRRMTDPGPQLPRGIQVCPEYLMPHDTTEKAIMKLTDMVCDHSIYYLSQETRSAYGATAKGLTLRKILDNRHQKRYERCWNLLWIVRLARLAAEAVLRFDLRDSDPHPQEIIVFYGADKKDSEMHLSPFLEVKIERSGPQGLSDTGGETDDEADQSNHQPKRQQVLLNLGNVLLQLGVKRDVKLGKAPSGPDQMKEYINKHADKTITGVHQKYADAVRSCTRFYGKEKAMGESAFRESFFKLIIEPLKDCESIIDGQEKEGKRLNTKH